MTAISEDDYARMPWHARARYNDRLAKEKRTLEAETADLARHRDTLTKQVAALERRLRHLDGAYNRPEARASRARLEIREANDAAAARNMAEAQRILDGLHQQRAAS